jgi:hypothetical protein
LAELVIFGIHDCNQVSPVEIEQSCMSLHRFGVTNENAGSEPAFRSFRRFPELVVPSGTSHCAQSAAIPV